MPAKPRLSRRKDLHDGGSIWVADGIPDVGARPALPRKNIEIAIVGAGISGALTALQLASDGHEVCVFDRRHPATGSTLASTALIQFELDTPLIELSSQIGKSNAERAYRRSNKAVHDLKALIEEHGLDAQWQDRQALFLAGDETGFRGLIQEADARRHVGLPSAYIGPNELRIIYGIERTGAIVSAGAGELDPVSTAASCLKKAKALGARIVAPCGIKDVRQEGNGVDLETDHGEKIRAQRVIIATGYEAPKCLPRDAFEIVSSWVIATQPLKTDTLWPGRCLIWEASDPYLYIRTTPDDRILVGGEDSGLTNPDRRAAAIPAKSRALLRKAEKLLNRDDLKVEFAWAGAFADSPTGLPIIKTLPEMPNALAVLGCGGNGITFSMIAAQVASAWAKGRKDADQDLFSGGRS